MPIVNTSVRFSTLPDYVPTYANAVLVNQVNNGLIIDFGFIDPLVISDSISTQETESSTSAPVVVHAKTINRMVISTATALQLFNQLQTQLADQLQIASLDQTNHSKDVEKIYDNE